MRPWPALIPVCFLAACVSIPRVTDLPEHLPPVSWYVAAWQDDSANQQYQSLDEYLVWVRRFYEGFNIAPGWDDLTRQVLERIPASDQEVVSSRLFELGRTISVEWAKSNEERLIDTRNAAVWRDALQEALSQGDLDNYLDRVDADVSAILAGSLAGEEIRFERYYVDEFDF
jgi:hypothetical protein